LVGLCCLFTGLGAVVGLIWSELWAIVAAMGVILALIRLRLFGHGEFLLIKVWLSRSLLSVLRMSRGVRFHQCEVHLQGSAEWKRLLNGLTDSAYELNLKSVLLDVNAPALHESYYAQWERLMDEGQEDTRWSTEIPLRIHGQTVGRLEVIGWQDEGSIAEKINRIAEAAEAFEAAVSSRSQPLLRTSRADNTRWEVP
jgi:UDP-GlcNAc:undecaprenyl-phosphate GlcNAc-1-phosphate transferase